MNCLESIDMLCHHFAMLAFLHFARFIMNRSQEETQSGVTAPLHPGSHPGCQQSCL